MKALDLIEAENPKKAFKAIPRNFVVHYRVVGEHPSFVKRSFFYNVADQAEIPKLLQWRLPHSELHIEKVEPYGGKRPMREAENPKAFLRGRSKGWNVEPVASTTYMLRALLGGEEMDVFAMDDASTKYCNDLTDYLNWLQMVFPPKARRDGGFQVPVPLWLGDAQAAGFAERYMRETGKPSFIKLSAATVSMRRPVGEAEDPKKYALGQREKRRTAAGACHIHWFDQHDKPHYTSFFHVADAAEAVALLKHNLAKANSPYTVKHVVSTYPIKEAESPKAALQANRSIEISIFRLGQWEFHAVAKAYFADECMELGGKRVPGIYVSGRNINQAINQATGEVQARVTTGFLSDQIADHLNASINEGGAVQVPNDLFHASRTVMQVGEPAYEQKALSWKLHAPKEVIAYIQRPENQELAQELLAKYGSDIELLRKYDGDPPTMEAENPKAVLKQLPRSFTYTVEPNTVAATYGAFIVRSMHGDQMVDYHFAESEEEAKQLGIYWMAVYKSLEKAIVYQPSKWKSFMDWYQAAYAKNKGVRFEIGNMPRWQEAEDPKQFFKDMPRDQWVRNDRRGGARPNDPETPSWGFASTVHPLHWFRLVKAEEVALYYLVLGKGMDNSTLPLKAPDLNSAIAAAREKATTYFNSLGEAENPKSTFKKLPHDEWELVEELPELNEPHHSRLASWRFKNRNQPKQWFKISKGNIHRTTYYVNYFRDGLTVSLGHAELKAPKHTYAFSIAKSMATEFFKNLALGEAEDPKSIFKKMRPKIPDLFVRVKAWLRDIEEGPFVARIKVTWVKDIVMTGKGWEAGISLIHNSPQMLPDEIQWDDWRDLMEMIQYNIMEGDPMTNGESDSYDFLAAELARNPRAEHPVILKAEWTMLGDYARAQHQATEAFGGPHETAANESKKGAARSIIDAEDPKRFFKRMPRCTWKTVMMGPDSFTFECEQNRDFKFRLDDMGRDHWQVLCFRGQSYERAMWTKTHVFALPRHDWNVAAHQAKEVATSLTLPELKVRESENPKAALKQAPRVTYKVAGQTRDNFGLKFFYNGRPVGGLEYYSTKQRAEEAGTWLAKSFQELLTQFPFVPEDWPNIMAWRDAHMDEWKAIMSAQEQQ